MNITSQTLEEAVNLETMMTNVLDKVQNSKEKAATQVFDLHVQKLEQEREHNERRQQEVAVFEAAGTLEMAKLVAQYTAEEANDHKNEAWAQQNVDTMERNKAFHNSSDGENDNNNNDPSSSSSSPSSHHHPKATTIRLRSCP